MKLSVLAEAVRENIDQTEVVIGDDPEISGIEHDSRKIRSGDLFACIPGAHADGHGFAQAAIANRAVALLCERRLAVDVAQIICPSARRGMAHAAAALAGNPSAAISVVGVTGTNGKTTVVTLLGKLLALLGDEVTVLGTLTGARTTPEANELQAALAQAVTDDNQRVVMEVSSHALDMGRVDGIEFEVVAFTNLSVDHLDYLDRDRMNAAARRGNPNIDKFCNACFSGEYPTGDITLERLQAIAGDRTQNRGEISCGAG